MERVTEFSTCKHSKTRLWVTAEAEREMEKHVDDRLAISLVGHAEDGLQTYSGKALVKEGDGVWAFKKNTWTTRIAGFFDTDEDRKNFVIGGVWYGKSGKGMSRPHMAEAVVARVERLKKAGVEYVQEESTEGENCCREDGDGKEVLRHPSHG